MTPPASTDAATTDSMSTIEATFARCETYQGVCVVDGWGARVRVERGHLEVSDGLGEHRRVRRYSKVDRTPWRLVVSATTGTVTLDALRWCDAVGVTVVFIDAEGRPSHASIGDVGRNDARLRRAQAATAGTDVGISLAIDLLGAKLAGQADVLAQRLGDTDASSAVRDLRTALSSAGNMGAVRKIEAAAAGIHWRGWAGAKGATLRFTTRDQGHIPDHWQAFQTRRSLVDPKGNRLAADPTNAVLNYLYRLAEIEATQAAIAVGLDPGFGIIHSDFPGRDSLVLDLVEPVRPAIETMVLDMAHSRVFRKVDFVESASGIVRVLPPVSHELTASMSTWATLLAPWAEQVASTIGASTGKALKPISPISGVRRRPGATATKAQQRLSAAPAGSKPKVPVQPRCTSCGIAVGNTRRRCCSDCSEQRRAEIGRIASSASSYAIEDPEARAARGRAISEGKRRAKEQRAVEPGFGPDDWAVIAAPLKTLPIRRIAQATGLSEQYAGQIRAGKQVPHPRHWAALKSLLNAEPAAETIRG